MKLEIENLSVALEGRDILRGVSLRVEEGEFLSLLGPSGCGKTTLLKTVAGIIAPRSGGIRLDGEDLTGLPPHKRGVVILFQDIRLFPHMTAAENVSFPLRMQGVGRRERLEQAEELLSRVRLPGWGPRRVESFSGGERQKLAIARAIYKDAPFVIMDEPTAALDPKAETEVLEGFDGMVGHKTAIYISHRLASCRFCEDILVFDRGKVVQHGTHEELEKQEGLYRELWNAQAQYYA